MRVTFRHWSQLTGLWAVALLVRPAATQTPSVNSLPSCGKTCVTNLEQKFAQFGCSSANDLTCLCGASNFVSGIRDCANQSCSSSDSKTVIAFIPTLCAVPSSSVSSSSSTTPSTTSSQSSSSTLLGSVSTTARSSTSTNESQSSTPASPSSATSNGGTASSTSDQTNNSTLSTGAKAGIGVGVSVAGLAILGAIFWLVRRRRSQPNNAPEMADNNRNRLDAREADYSMGRYHH